MGKFQATRKHFALFVALVACNCSLQSHARLLKPLNQHSSSLKTETVASEDNSRKSQSQPPLPPLKTNIPTPSSMMPNYNEASFGSDSSAAHTNAFQPTAPGNSPGVGHKHFTEEGNYNKVKATRVVVQTQTPGVKVSVTEGSINDSKKTDPGHSPGVGHAYQNKIGHLY